MKNTKYQYSNGNTLAEFAVVTALMATLAATASPKLSELSENGKKEKSINEIGKIVSTQPKLFVNQDKILKAKKNMSLNNKCIVLGISASGPTKRWEIKNFIKLSEKINQKFPSKFYLAAGKNDQPLINEMSNSNIGSNCISLNNLKINEMMPIIANCNLYCGNDTGFMHISAALNLKAVALFIDSPVLAYGKYSTNINAIIPEGETEETTTHDTKGSISFDKVYNKCIELLTN